MMNVEVHFNTFSTSEGAARKKAVHWMKEQYQKYGNRIISSNFAEDDTSVTAYITVLDEPLIKIT